MREFDLDLQPSELGEKAFVQALTNQRDSLLKRPAEASPDLGYMLLLRAEASVLREQFKQTRILIETERENRRQKSVQGGNTLLGHTLRR